MKQTQNNIKRQIAAVLAGVLLFLAMPFTALPAHAETMISPQYTSNSTKSPMYWEVGIDQKKMTVYVEDKVQKYGGYAMARICSTTDSSVEYDRDINTYDSNTRYDKNRAILFLDASKCPSPGQYEVRISEGASENGTFHTLDKFYINVTNTAVTLNFPGGERETNFLKNKIRAISSKSYNSSVLDYEPKNKADYDKLIAFSKSLVDGKSLTQVEYVKIIHDWITQNIAYDFSKNGGSKQAPEETFMLRRGTCRDYAELAKVMFNAINIPCMVIDGSVSSTTSEIVNASGDYHVWNAVAVSDWYLFDFTWDSMNKYYGENDPRNVLNASPEYTYFMISPESFGRTHYSKNILVELSQAVGIIPGDYQKEYTIGDAFIKPTFYYINEDGRNLGRVSCNVELEPKTAYIAGTQTIYCTAENGYRGNYQVTVKEKPVVNNDTTSVKINTAGLNTNMKVDETITLTASTVPADKVSSVMWGYDHSAFYASNTSGGTTDLYALREGTYEIKAGAWKNSNSSERIYDSVIITVSGKNSAVQEDVSVTGIKITNAVNEIDENASTTFRASVIPTTAKNQNVQWSVESLGGTATIDQNGYLSAKKAGNIVVTAKSVDGGFTDRVNVTIKSINSQSEESPDVEFVEIPDVTPGPTPAPELEGGSDLSDEIVITQPTGFIIMYRLYNSHSGEHFYTGNANERDYLSSIGWNYEGEAWKAPETSSSPVYRLYNPNSSDHHYTLSVYERDQLVAMGWNDEGIGWYSDDKKTVGLHRLYNPNCTGAGSHHYTISKYEANYLTTIGWRYENYGWYGV